METKFKGVSTSKCSWGEKVHPASRDIVKNPPKQPSQLGRETWSNSRSSKVAIKGGQK